ncbi:hypothetical protein AB6A40_011384 [Gnathostoma spinigerum]|uniref:Uncharacterized protein n=1 Tax=Gnathostoma spinigerum TaxID=75299 RepID=A0ABD6F4L5_9BILA
MLIRGNLYCPGDLFTTYFRPCGLLYKAVEYPAKEKDWKGMAEIGGHQYVFTSTKLFHLLEAGRVDGQGFPISHLISC